MKNFALLLSTAALSILTTSVGFAANPVAQAGYDQVVMDTNDDGLAVVLLDASASTDADGDALSYRWLDGNTELGTQAILTLTLAEGVHTFTLEVSDGLTKDTDEVSVYVGDATPDGGQRIPLRGGEQAIFANGINLAWNNYGDDVINLDEDFFEMVLDSLQNRGGNALRWWLHPNGRVNPLFNGDGTVREYHPNMVNNVRTVLDMAYERGVTLSLCLWSFDILQDQGQDQQMMLEFFEDSVKTQTYIDNALVPLLEALGDHPAVLTWEILNEAEGMTEEFGWTPIRTTMAAVQAFTNRVAGAIHRAVPTAQVSTGIWNIRAMTDVDGNFNYYGDDRLIAAGGDPDGTLDFYQVHFYPEHNGNEFSPFHRPASYWQLDKPIVIGEYPVKELEGQISPGYTTTETYQLGYAYGYAGVMPWTFVNFDGGNFINAREGMEYLATTFASEIVVDNSGSLNQVPDVVASIPAANVKLGEAVVVTNHVDLNTIFNDPEDGTNLTYTLAGNTNPLLVLPEVSEAGLVTLALVDNATGTASVRLRATDTDGASTSASLTVNVYDPAGNLALFAPIAASTIEDDNAAGTLRIPSLANDGNPESRWSSEYADDQWIALDLGANYAVNRVVLDWEVAYGESYTVQLSEDSVTWTPAVNILNSDGGTDNLTFDSTGARYVRLDLHTRGTEFGFSLWELKVYAANRGGDGVTSLPEEPFALQVYPNPTTDYLRITTEGRFTANLLTLDGRQVRAILATHGTTELDIRALPEGVYLLRVATEKGMVTRRVVRN